MRLKPAIVAMAALGATALVAGGLYQYYALNAPKHGGQSSAAAPAGAARSGELFSMSPLDVLRPVPELSFVDGNGRQMTLAAFRGQTVLLNVWATWCVPCRKEMPALDRLQARLGGPDFQVLALSIDRQGLPAVKAFYQELGLRSLGIYVDQSGKATQRLGAVGIPTTLLVDREGREIGRKVGPAEWDGDEAVRILKRHVTAGAAGAEGSVGAR